MKIKQIVTLVASIASVALSPVAWAGRGGGGGGGGGGGFHGGGGGGFHGGGGGFHGGGFGGGRAFGGPSRSFGGFRPPMSVSRSPGFRASGVSGMHHTGTNIPNMSRVAPRQRGIASTARPATRSTAPRMASNPRVASNPRAVSNQNRGALAARQQGGARPNGLNGRTDHIAERHEGNWNRDWDRHHSHFRDGRFFVFDNGFWWGLDDGYYPWDYYPYSDYDYDPYDYYVGDPSTAPANYQAAPTPDATVENVQTQLTQQGYYSGPIDGLFGPTTRDALARYQTSKGLNVTGSLSPDTLQSFGLPPQVATN